jgi:hypothetical protein
MWSAYGVGIAAEATGRTIGRSRRKGLIRASGLPPRLTIEFPRVENDVVVRRTLWELYETILLKKTTSNYIDSISA